MEFKLRHSINRQIDHLGNLLLSPPFGGFNQFRNYGSRQTRKIALTFDDGPSRPATEVLLDTLGELNVKATFFCVGINVALNPDLVARAFSEGHVIGNHSLRHSRKASIRFGETEHIERSAAEICRVIGREPRLYRPPWGWLTPWESRRLHHRGYTIIGWDVYTLDWQLPEPDGIRIAEKAVQDTKPGSILLFHDAFPLSANWEKKETVVTMRHLVPALQALGYEFVTVDELLGINAYGPILFDQFKQAS